MLPIPTRPAVDCDPQPSASDIAVKTNLQVIPNAVRVPLTTLSNSSVPCYLVTVNPEILKASIPFFNVVSNPSYVSLLLVVVLKV